MKRTLVFLALGLAGCTSGDWNVPGNRKSIGIDRTVTTVTLDANGKPVTVINRTIGRYVANGQSSDVGGLEYDGTSGKLKVTAAKLSDVVAGEQGTTARQISADAKETMIAGMQVIGQLAPLFGGGGLGGSTIGGVATGGATATAVSPTLALAREAALQRIAACPFMGQAEKDRLAALVPLAPESVLVKILASLPTTRPE